MTAVVNGGADEHILLTQLRVASGSTVNMYATVNRKNLGTVSKVVLFYIVNVLDIFM